MSIFSSEIIQLKGHALFTTDKKRISTARRNDALTRANRHECHWNVRRRRSLHQFDFQLYWDEDDISQSTWLIDEG